jgi:hypothetical protein
VCWRHRIAHPTNGRQFNNTAHLALRLRCLLALLLLDQCRRVAVRLLSGLLCTLAGRRRLLRACGAFELPQHLRRLMVTEPDTHLESGLSSDSLCI